MMRMRAAHAGHVINPATEIVIEGYPRSGNTFAVVALQFASNRVINIAHHLHAPAQVLRGVERGLPVLVLIRDPVDAIVSQAIRHPRLSLRDCLVTYTSFYRRLLPVADRVVKGHFKQVTSNYGTVIADLNRTFGTTFQTFIHSSSNVEAVFEVVDRLDQLDTTRRSAKETDTVARPTQERWMARSQYLARLMEPEFKRAVDTTRDMYRSFVEVR